MNAQHTSAHDQAPPWRSRVDAMLAGTTAYIEMRAVKPGGGMAAAPLHTREIADIEKFYVAHNGVNHLYIGAATRRKGGGKKEDCREACMLWADVDFKDFAGG